MLIRTRDELATTLERRMVTTGSVAYHRRVLDGICEPAPQRASDAMLAHLSVGPAAFGDDIDQHLDMITWPSIGRLSASSPTLDHMLQVSRKMS